MPIPVDRIIEARKEAKTLLRRSYGGQKKTAMIRIMTVDIFQMNCELEVVIEIFDSELLHFHAFVSLLDEKGHAIFSFHGA